MSVCAQLHDVKIIGDAEQQWGHLLHPVHMVCGGL